jgi:hypothetical protein
MQKFFWSLSVVLLISGCAATKYGSTASGEKDNLIAISSGTLNSGNAQWLSYYVIDKTIKECYSQLTMYSAVKIECQKLKVIPAANKILKDIGL